MTAVCTIFLKRPTDGSTSSASYRKVTFTENHDQRLQNSVLNHYIKYKDDSGIKKT